VSFSAPQAASTGAGAAAGYGFSVARFGNRVGVTWGASVGGNSTLWYREATAGPTLAFGPAVQVATSASLRGYKPTLIFSSSGVPYIGSEGFGVPYTGPRTGCNNVNRNRINVDYFDGTSWVPQSYCYNFNTNADPYMGSIATTGPNVLVGGMQTGLLTTSIVDGGSELAEPWSLMDDIAFGGFSSVQSVTTVTDVHHVYTNINGGIGYARQDGLDWSDGNPARGLDATAVSATGGFPGISKPTADAGAYVITWTEGTAIRQSIFSGAITSLKPAATVVTAAGPVTAMTLELEYSVAPALTWQVGNSIYFGIATTASRPVLVATPPSAPADNSSAITVTASSFRDVQGNLLPDGSLVTVATTGGNIGTADADPVAVGIQVASSGGQLTFSVSAKVPGSFTASAMAAAGGPSGSTTILFTALNGALCTAPAMCTSGNCVDGVCCDGPCAGGCGACNLPASLGRCTPVDAGTAGGCVAYLCDGVSSSCPTSCVQTSACAPGFTCGPSSTCDAPDAGGGAPRRFLAGCGCGSTPVRGLLMLAVVQLILRKPRQYSARRPRNGRIGR
jgi:hypothetical protein